MTEEPLPAWSLSADAVERIALPEAWPGRLAEEVAERLEEAAGATRVTLGREEWYRLWVAAWGHGVP